VRVVAYIVIWAALALVPAKIAQRKGRSFAIWYVLGLLVWIFAVVAALIIKDKRPRPGVEAAD
jgi:hypothetical protein